MTWVEGLPQDSQGQLGFWVEMTSYQGLAVALGGIRYDCYTLVPIPRATPKTLMFLKPGAEDLHALTVGHSRNRLQTPYDANARNLIKKPWPCNPNIVGFM